MVAKYFYPRPPRGGRRFPGLGVGVVRGISIHALREEGDGLVCYTLQAAGLFLSTPSARRATSTSRTNCPVDSLFLSTPSARRATQSPSSAAQWTTYFYPRPPRGGRRAYAASTMLPQNFYPRPPRGGRQHPPERGRGQAKFLSTPSARRATSRIYA